MRKSFLFLLTAIAAGLIALAPTADARADDRGGMPPADVESAQPEAAYSGKWIEVNLSRQVLRAWDHGRVVLTTPVSTGVRRYPTRPGTFRIYVKYPATRMRGPGYNLPGVPWTMYYSGSYAIHGTYWHHNFGHPMSHGCVNLPTSAAARLYRWAPVGTRVVIHY